MNLGLSQPSRAPSWRLAALGIAATLCIAGFMTVNVQTDWTFILEYRGARLGAMLLVAYAMGMSTVLFQTITHNRILTPSLLGFDALYVLVQSLALLLLGGSQTVELAPPLRFSLEVLVMVLLALLFFRLLFSGAVRSLHLMILLGILFGMLFRELAELAMRVTDPTEFMVRGRTSASFARIDTSLLGASAVIVAGVSLWAARLRRNLDVLLLGRDVAINLGVNYQRVVTQLMVFIAVLVSVATILVGPSLFFGLLIANLAYWFTGSHQHRWTLPAAVLTGIICLVGGQLLFEHALSTTLALSMVIELVGGLLFVTLLLRGVKQ